MEYKNRRASFRLGSLELLHFWKLQAQGHSEEEAMEIVENELKDRFSTPNILSPTRRSPNRPNPTRQSPTWKVPGVGSPLAMGIFDEEPIDEMLPLPKQMASMASDVVEYKCEDKASAAKKTATISRGTAASSSRASPPKSSSLRSSPPKTSPPKSPFPALGRPSPSKAGPTKTVTSKPVSSTSFLKAGSKTRAQTVGKATGSVGTLNPSKIKRKLVSAAATISYGSPVNRVTPSTALKKVEAVSPMKIPLTDIHAVETIDSAKSLSKTQSPIPQKAGSPRRAVIPCGQLSLPRQTVHPIVLFGQTAYDESLSRISSRRKLPARGSIMANSHDGDHTIFDQGPSPIHPRPPPPSPTYLDLPVTLLVSEQEETTRLSDWEIINWPWITPFAPATGLAEHVRRDFEHQYYQRYRALMREPTTIRRPPPKQRKAWENAYLAGKTPLPRPGTKRVDDSAFLAGGKIFEDNPKSDTQSVQCYKVPARREEFEASKTYKSIENDPAIVSYGPSRPSAIKMASPRKASIRFIKEDARRVGSRSNLEQNLLDFTRAVSQMKKGDRQVIENFLEALRNVEGRDESSEMPASKKIKEDSRSDLRGASRGASRAAKVDPTSAQSTQARLNPAAADFTLGSKELPRDAQIGAQEVRPSSVVATAEPTGQVVASNDPMRIMPLQETTASNKVSKPLQDHKPPKQNQRPVVVLSKPAGGIENRRMRNSDGTSNAAENKHAFQFVPSSAGAHAFPKHLGEPIWIKTLVSTAKKLERVAKKHAIDLPSDQSELKMAGTTFLPVPPLLPSPPVLEPITPPQVLLDDFLDDTGSGREANRMEPSWAERRIETFTEKYPLTGTKAEKVLPMSLEEFQEKYAVESSAVGDSAMPACKQLASDIQQKLEIILYHHKEKKALEKLTEELASRALIPWV